MIIFLQLLLLLVAFVIIWYIVACRVTKIWWGVMMIKAINCLHELSQQSCDTMLQVHTHHEHYEQLGGSAHPVCRCQLACLPELLSQPGHLQLHEW